MRLSHVTVEVGEISTDSETRMAVAAAVVA